MDPVLHDLASGSALVQMDQVTMDPRAQDALLKDPAVIAAIGKAGKNALSDPEVQKQILAVCKQKFPELAASAQQQLSQWANDPELQRRAREYGVIAVGYAGYAGQAAGEEYLKLFEQGPAGVRFLAFFGGVGSCVNAGFVIINPLELLGCFTYLIAVYQTLFSLSTMLFEAKAEWIAFVPGLDAYQNMLIDKVKFLSEVAGRGLFYGFQGTLWLAFASLDKVQNALLGLYFLQLSVMHLLMHYGVMPQHIVQKMRDDGYIPVRTTAPDADDVTHNRGGLLDTIPEPAGDIAPPAAEFNQAQVDEALQLETGSARQVQSPPVEPVGDCGEPPVPAVAAIAPEPPVEPVEARETTPLLQVDPIAKAEEPPATVSPLPDGNQSQQKKACCVAM